MTRTPVADYDFPEAGSVDMHKLECANHPECKYLWKGPGRSLHYVSSMVVRECGCSFLSLVVVDEYTIPSHAELGTWLLSNSGPSHFDDL